MEKEVTVEELLNDTIVEQLEKLKGIEPGTEEHTRATEDAAKLCKIYLDDKKAVEDRESDAEIKQKQIDAERDIKTDELIAQKKYRWVDWTIKGVEIAVGIGCVILNTRTFRKSWKEGLDFETNGAWSGNLTRGISNKVLNFVGKKN